MPKFNSVSRCRSLIFLGLVTACLPAVAVRSGWAVQQSREPVLAANEDNPLHVKIREKLASPITLEFVETPLSDIIDFMKDFTGANIVIHKPALDEEGITSDSPISIHVQSIKLSSALNQMLRPHHLTWILKDDCLIITSQVVADSHVVTRSYPVGDLVASREEGEKLVALARWLLATNGKELSSDRIPFLDSLKAIVLTHNYSAHARLARLLEQLRGGADLPDTVKKIHSKLNDPVTLEFVETPLSDIVDFLKDLTGVNIVLDKPALDEEGVNADTPCSIHIESISLSSALKILLGQYNLAARIEDECLVITSNLSDQNHFELRTYPVGKMLGERPKPSHEEWLQLAYSILGPHFGMSVPADSRKIFPPGSKVRVQWAGAYFPATVVALNEMNYQVRFRVGETEREETVAAGVVTDPNARAPEPQPIIEFFEPRQSLVVLGSDSLHGEVESLIGLVVKTAERSGK